MPHYRKTANRRRICCAKLSEAENLADCGVEDIFIANQIVQQEKLGYLATLAGRCRLSVCVDTAENVLALESTMAAAGSTLYCLVEYEVGLKHCGVETHEEVDKSPLYALLAYSGDLHFLDAVGDFSGEINSD